MSGDFEPFLSRSIPIAPKVGQLTFKYRMFVSLNSDLYIVSSGASLRTGKNMWPYFSNVAKEILSGPKITN